MVNFKLYNDDCRNILKNIPDNSIDLIVTDLPFNNRACLQWGCVNNISVFPDIKTVTFPIAFNNRCAGVVYFSNYSTDDIAAIFKGLTSVGNITKSNFVISTNMDNGGTWLAIGY